MLKYFRSFFLFFIISIFISGCSFKTLKEKFIDISNEHDVSYKTMMAICKKESNLDPYVINVNKSIFNIQKGPHYFDTWIGANAYMDLVLDPLFLNYDIGMCQINKVHLDRLNLDNEDMLDEEKNIEIAAKIYKYNLRQCGNNIICALSMYNTGYKNSTIGKKYAYKVLRKRKEMFGE